MIRVLGMFFAHPSHMVPDMKFIPYFTLLIIFCLFGFMHAHAQTGNNVDIMPAQSAKENGIQIDTALATHPPLKISPDKSEILVLDEDAGTIIVGNPAHLNVLADSATRLILVPRSLGATYFTVLDQNGGVIMQRHILIAAPQENYVRIRRSCAGQEGCTATSVYYCPDACHSVTLPGAEASDTAGDGSGAEGDAGSAAELEEGAEDLTGASVGGPEAAEE